MFSLKTCSVDFCVFLPNLSKLPVKVRKKRRKKLDDMICFQCVMEHVGYSQVKCFIASKMKQKYIICAVRNN